MNITEKNVAKLEAGPARQQFTDDAQTGFGVRVEASGAKVYYWYAKVRGKSRFRALGQFRSVTVADARDEARKLTARAIAWKQAGYPEPDPFEKSAQPASVEVPVFRQLVDAYLERHVELTAKNVRRASYDVRKMAETHFQAWLDAKLDDLGVEDLLTVKNACGKHHVAANRCIQFIRRLLNWSGGKVDGKIRFWPVSNFALEVDTYKESKRKRYLSGEESDRFGAALDEETHRDLRDFLLISSESGARRGDILSMRWQDILWEEALWRVPNPKNGESYDVQLLNGSMSVLKRRRRENPDAGAVFVFPGTGRDGHLGDIPKKPWKEFRKRAQLRDFRLHDVRHSVASGLANAGVPLPQIGAILGHRSLQSTQRYSHLINDSLREAREKGREKMRQLAAAAKRRIGKPTVAKSARLLTA